MQEPLPLPRHLRCSASLLSPVLPRGALRPAEAEEWSPPAQLLVRPPRPPPWRNGGCGFGSCRDAVTRSGASSFRPHLRDDVDAHRFRLASRADRMMAELGGDADRDQQAMGDHGTPPARPSRRGGPIAAPAFSAEQLPLAHDFPRMHHSMGFAV